MSAKKDYQYGIFQEQKVFTQFDAAGEQGCSSGEMFLMAVIPKFVSPDVLALKLPSVIALLARISGSCNTRTSGNQRLGITTLRHRPRKKHY